VGTKSDQQRLIDLQAMHLVDGLLIRPEWDIVRLTPDNVGIDYRVDMVGKVNRRLNVRVDDVPIYPLYLQVKGRGPQTRDGQPKRLESEQGFVSQSMELEHLSYYMDQPTPVFLVVVDVEKKQAYWVFLQEYITKDLKDSLWREDLRKYRDSLKQRKALAKVKGKKTGKGKGQKTPKKTPPEKVIRVPLENDLASLDRFAEEIKRARGYMCSLAVQPGIRFQEQELEKIDDRFMIRATATNERTNFQIIPKENVIVNVSITFTKEEFEEFGRGNPIQIKPGKFEVQGSELIRTMFHNVAVVIDWRPSNRLRRAGGRRDG
jgi:hypothetical protein